MEIERYDNLFFPQPLEQTFLAKKKTYIISQLSTNKL